VEQLLQPGITYCSSINGSASTGNNRGLINKQINTKCYFVINQNNKKTGKLTGGLLLNIAEKYEREVTDP